jgi:hypothetical protein
MRTVWAAALAVALAACEELPPDTDAQKLQVEDAFVAWVNQLVKGNADAAYRGLSEANKSQWLFDLLKRGDRTANAWRLKLEGRARTDIDLWLNYFKDKSDGRPERLPTEVLDSEGVLAVWRTTFEEQKDPIKVQMAKLRILEIYTDDAAASVIVRNVVGKTEMYQMVFERGGWKVDHHRGQVQEAPR